MASRARLQRIQLREYGPPKEILRSLSRSVGKPTEQIVKLLLAAGERVRQLLRLSGNPIEVTPGGVRATDIAGLLRVSPQIELEIAPKFLGCDTDQWREDFFYLAAISTHGRLLASEQLAAATGARGDLATLVARAMITMFWNNHRRPLRTYRRSEVTDFAIDGDVEVESLIFPTQDGFSQRVIAYDRKNIFNATILRAVQALMPEVREPQTRRQLARVAEVLTPQRGSAARLRNVLPTRSRQWNALYGLAQQVLEGFGLSYDPAEMRAPGFILHTWRVWEDTLTLGLRLGLGSRVVKAQQLFALGSRVAWPPTGGEPSAVHVIPDVTVRGDTGAAETLLDAKYKGRGEMGRTRIAESDLYEALAFARASGCAAVGLIYPASGVNRHRELGTVELLETIRVAEIRIIAVDVQTSGISRVGGLRTFAANLASGVTKCIADATSAT